MCFRYTLYTYYRSRYKHIYTHLLCIEMVFFIYLFFLYSTTPLSCCIFYSWPWIRLPPNTTLVRGGRPAEPARRYSTRQVIYSLSGRPSRNWKIHPGTRDKTGHIHGSVWFPNLCAATKTSSEIYYCGRDPPPHHPDPTLSDDVSSDLSYLPRAPYSPRLISYKSLYITVVFQ